MVARSFITYAGRVLRRAFTGTFVIVDLLGVILLVLSLNQPKVPLFISLGVFIIILVISSFLVWKDAENDNKRLRAKIATLKDGTPKYSVDVGAIEKFSIAKVVQQRTSELEAVRAKLQSQRRIDDSPVGALASNLRSLTQFSHILGEETLEDKEERLTKHLAALKAFEHRLNSIYKVPLFFEATRADGNVELEVEPLPACALIVKDAFVSNNMPETSAPSRFGVMPLTGLNHIPAGGFANRLYPYSYAEDGKGYSKLNKINASRKYRVFDEDFYVETDNESIDLKITVHSEKINEPQVISVKLDLRGVPTDEVNHLEEDE